MYLTDNRPDICTIKLSLPMKRTLFLVLLVCSFGLSAQTISVTTDQQTVPELVNDVLINSPCANAQNVTWRTGSNFGSHNGIGKFTNTNPNFPMTEGVILSTGNVFSAPGPNNTMLDEGSNAWLGDTDLEAVLAAANIGMNSTNATVLEFDFTSISSQFSFDFIFASEEYGNFQCEYSDAFAFLLTNLNTGVTTNLAVVPGTNLPISVVTIRDFLYNSSCPSVNAEYFGRFNGGTGMVDSATNFNGQTKVLTASSILTPNTPYHIKLVIADRGDYKSDSAIFIAANTFNIGQNVLGPDFLVSSNTAICYGATHELATTLDPAMYTFQWLKNGVVISGQTAATLNVTSPGVYTVSYTKIIGDCLPETDEVTVEFYAAFDFPTPKNIYKCDNGSTLQTFDIYQNNSLITANLPTNSAVSYHLTLQDAQNNVSPLPQNYLGASNQEIFVRVENSITGCSAIKSFKLVFLPPAVAYTAPDLKKCERSNTQHSAVFNLDANNGVILGTQSEEFYTVTYYNSESDAINAINPLGNTLVSAGQTIYVRVQNISDPSCYSTTSFNLILTTRAPVDILPDEIVCDQFILPQLVNGNYFTAPNGGGTPLFAGHIITQTQVVYIYNPGTGADACPGASNFKITVIDPLTIAQPDGTYCDKFTVPSIAYGNFYTQPDGQGQVIAQGSTITTSQTIYIYYAAPVEPFCIISLSFDVTIAPSPVIAPVQDVFDCESYPLPALTVGNYFTGPNGTGVQLAAGTVINTTQRIYIYAENTNPILCAKQRTFKIFIGDLQPEDVVQCEPYQLPALPIGTYYTGPNATGELIAANTIISASTILYIFIDNNSQACAADVQFSITINQPAVDTLPNVAVCGGYTLPALTNGAYYTATGGAGEQLFEGDVITSNMTIYIYAVIADGCSNQSSFKVKINAPAQLDPRSDIDICNSYTLTPLTNGNYYTGPSGTGQLLPGGTIIYESQTIYMYSATNTTPSCTAESSFELFIFSVEADSLGPITACDEYVLPALTVGNYYANPGGPSANSGMLHAGQIITESTTLYIFTEAGDRIRCEDENIVSITINKTPSLALIADVQQCTSYTLPALTVGNYFTAPNGTGTPLLAGDEITTNQTIYVYAETGTVPNCFDEVSFDVYIFKVNSLPDVTTCVSYKLPNLAIGNYYTESGGNGTQIPAGTTITASGTYYIYAVSNFLSGCSDETDFVVTIVPQPEAFSVPTEMTTICDDDDINDGIFDFDVTGLSATVLGNQTGTEFSVTFHESVFDANQNQNAVTSTTKPYVYARVSNSLAPDCFETVKITIFVKKLPEPTFKDAYICIDSETGLLISPTTIQSGLHPGTHSFIWKNATGETVGTSANYIATLPGVYTLTSTSSVTSCTSTRSVTMNPSEPATITYSTSEDFANQPFVTIIATGVGGNYEYQLDGGQYQDSPTFYNLSSGIHIISVRDKNGCGDATTSILIIKYTPFFTPNGDGANDTWNIPDLKAAENVYIRIMDRYGKVVANLSPNGPGWDGTLNGHPLPSSDYWFVVSYEIRKEIKEFRAHFSLKR